MVRSRSPQLFLVIAKIAQLVEHDLAKVGVAGSSPVFRSFPSPDGGIGRRAGLKHQWSNPSRFDPGSGYFFLTAEVVKLVDTLL